jgi:hypothetical protein
MVYETLQDDGGGGGFFCEREAKTSPSHQHNSKQASYSSLKLRIHKKVL